jgi:peroxiredoxin
VVTAACLALIACGGGSGGGAAAADDTAGAFRPLAVGDLAPAYAMRTLDGDTIRIGSADVATLLNVWATWCTSCAEEMQALDSLQAEFNARGLRVVGVSVDAGSDARVRRFAEANHLRFAVVHDAAGAIERAYRVVGVPTTFIIGRNGLLLWQHTGNIDDSLGEVRAAVTRALAAPQSKQPPAPGP